MDRSACFRVLRADDHGPSSIEFDQKLAPNFEVVANVRDNQALIRAALDLKPDVIIVDMGMSAQDGFKAVKEIVRCLPQTRVIFQASWAACRCCAERALASTIGTCGFVTRRAAARGLSNAIRLALEAGRPSPTCAADRTSTTTLEMPNPSAAEELTRREFEVLALLAGGVSMKGIAHQLGITYRTVTFHKYRMMKRLGIKTNAGIMHYAINRGVGNGREETAKTPAAA
jgi:DNA-binding NarL/FixJ family response regulator